MRGWESSGADHGSGDYLGYIIAMCVCVSHVLGDSGWFYMVIRTVIHHILSREFSNSPTNKSGLSPVDGYPQKSGWNRG